MQGNLKNLADQIPGRKTKRKTVLEKRNGRLSGILKEGGEGLEQKGKKILETADWHDISELEYLNTEQRYKGRQWVSKN